MKGKRGLTKRTKLEWVLFTVICCCACEWRKGGWDGNGEIWGNGRKRNGEITEEDN